MSSELETHSVDRTSWNLRPGRSYPWDGEPDKEQWFTAAGLPGLIVRSTLTGALCGYAAVEADHPFYRLDCDQPGIPEAVRVAGHGKINYAAPCSATGPVCHVPEPGHSDDVWWFGFDCAGGGDYKPNMVALLRRVSGPPGIGIGGSYLGTDYFDQLGNPYEELYRDIGYVRARVENLALALREANTS